MTTSVEETKTSRRSRPAAPVANGTTATKRTRAPAQDIPEPTVVTAGETTAFARQARLDRIEQQLRELKSDEYLSFEVSNHDAAERLRTRLQTSMRTRKLTLATQIEEDGGKTVIYVRLREPRQSTTQPSVPDAPPVDSTQQTPPPDA